MGKRPQPHSPSTQQPNTRSIKRENDILLGRFERAVLPAMARRLPNWVTPNVLTLVALGGSVAMFAGYALASSYLGWVHLASAGLVVHWWGDSLDGTLARVRGLQRERFGYYVDHQADAISTVVLCAGLATGGLMATPIALSLAVAILLMMNHVNMVTVARGVFKISFWRIGPTEGRLALILANTALWMTGNPSVDVYGTVATSFTILGIAGVVAIGGIYIASAVRETRLIGALDPRPEQGLRPHAIATPIDTSERPEHPTAVPRD